MAKIVIRKGTFETNSSSMHSISICPKDNKMELVKLTGMDEYAVDNGEYGWGYEELHGWEPKLSYVFSHLINQNEDVESDKRFAWLKELFKDYTGVDLVCGSKKGYIDHQSTDLLNEFLSLSDEEIFKSKIKNIVFNKKIAIIIDNDNH